MSSASHGHLSTTLTSSMQSWIVFFVCLFFSGLAATTAPFPSSHPSSVCKVKPLSRYEPLRLKSLVSPSHQPMPKPLQLLIKQKSARGFLLVCLTGGHNYIVFHGVSTSKLGFASPAAELLCAHAKLCVHECMYVSVCVFECHTRQTLFVVAEVCVISQRVWHTQSFSILTGSRGLVLVQVIIGRQWCCCLGAAAKQWCSGPLVAAAIPSHS